jgi:antitoxin YefM
MTVVNFSEFRNNLKSNLDSVSDDKEVVIISRSKDKNIVLIALSEYNSMIETIHLMQSENNRKRIDEALQEMAVGKFLTNALIED